MKRKKNENLELILSAFFVIIVMSSCQNSTKSDVVKIDNDFKALFYADSNGISGADGIFSVPLKDGSSVFFLGDCFLGKVVDGARDANTKMMRNAFVVINKEQTEAKSIYSGEYNNPRTLMEPVNELGDSTYRWYWPGHGFVKNDTLYVFALNLYNETSAVVKSTKNKDDMDEVDKLTEEMFAFRIGQIDLLSFSLPDFKHIETHKVAFDYAKNQIDFGNCVMVDGDYVYIFGTKNSPGISKIHVARVLFNSKIFYNNWEYFNGDEWTTDIKKSVPIDLDISVSEQFSIFKYKEQYVLLTQERSGTDIYTYISEKPYKDFYNKKKIYHTQDAENDTTKNIFSYNALAHVQYIENDELLVSYCVNSRRVRDVFENVEAYRAKFLRVPMRMIFK